MATAAILWHKKTPAGVYQLAIQRDYDGLWLVADTPASGGSICVTATDQPGTVRRAFQAIADELIPEESNDDARKDS